MNNLKSHNRTNLIISSEYPGCALVFYIKFQFYIFL